MEDKNFKPFSFTLYGDPKTKKNSSSICFNRNTGRRFIRPSKTYTDYEKSLQDQLVEVRKHNKIANPLGSENLYNVSCIFFRETKRRVDLTNLLEAIDDIMVNANLFIDDDRNVIFSHDGSRVYYDKENPRTIVSITKVNEETKWQTK